MFLHENFTMPNLIEAGFLAVIKQKNLITQQNVNQVFYDQRTALHIAVISNQLQIVQFLLKLNPDLTLEDCLGLRAADYIELKENKHVFEQIMKYFPKSQNQVKEQKGINEENLTIWRASQLGLKYLEPFFTRQNETKTHYKSPFTKDQLGRKAIHSAAISGNTQTFNFLIQHKFDPFQEDDFGFNCYHYIWANPWNPLNTMANKKYLNLNFQVKQNHYDVVVIGSGAAGVGAGVTLARNGVNFIVLEARDRIGGRILSTQISGVQLDLGACWVHSYSKNNPICKEANLLKWKSRKSQNRSDTQYVSELDTQYVSELKPNLSQKQIHSAHILQQTYFAIVQQQAAKSQKDLSIEEAGKQYYEKHIATLNPQRKALVDMFINMTEHYHASTSKGLSAKYFEQQEDIGGDFTPDGSYFKLLKAIANTVKFEDKTKFGTVVQEINYSKENDYCQVKTKDGQIYYAKKIISSLPLGILKAGKVKFTPQLPESHLYCIKKLGFGTMNKVIVSFEQPFWKQNPSWIRIACEQKGKFPAIYNFSTQDKHILCCFVTDNFAQSISGLKDEEILDSFLNVIKKSFKKQQIKVLDYSITRWDKDQYSLGSYTHFDVDSNMETTRKLRSNIDEKLWMVGQHCYGQHIGCAHGAFQSGIWAAQEILASFKKAPSNEYKK